MNAPWPTMSLGEVVRHRKEFVQIDDLQGKVDRPEELQAQAAAELDALLPSILDKAFKGEL